VEDDRGLGAGGQLAQSDLRYSRYLGVGGIKTRVGLEKDFDDRLPIDGGRFDVLDVVDRRGENALEAGREPAFHLFRIEPSELPGDSDLGNIDVRKDVRWRAQDYDRAGQQNQQRQNDKCIRTIESESNYPHSAVNSTIRQKLQGVRRASKKQRCQKYFSEFNFDSPFMTAFRAHSNPH